MPLSERRSLSYRGNLIARAKTQRILAFSLPALLAHLSLSRNRFGSLQIGAHQFLSAITQPKR